MRRLLADATQLLCLVAVVVGLGLVELGLGLAALGALGALVLHVRGPQ